MKLQQLRYLCETANQDMNLSRAAKNLHTSQPAISKQIQLLEEELGVDIFLRNGKRIVKITPPGHSARLDRANNCPRPFPHHASCPVRKPGVWRAAVTATAAQSGADLHSNKY